MSTNEEDDKIKKNENRESNDKVQFCHRTTTVSHSRSTRGLRRES